MKKKKIIERTKDIRKKRQNMTEQTTMRRKKTEIGKYFVFYMEKKENKPQGRGFQERFTLNIGFSLTSHRY